MATDSPFCDMCPGAADGYWATGHEAWERCWLLGFCGASLDAQAHRGDVLNYEHFDCCGKGMVPRVNG